MNPRELTNEELAAVIRAIKSTGICPSRDEVKRDPFLH